MRAFISSSKTELPRRSPPGTSCSIARSGFRDPQPKFIFTCSWSDFFITEADAWRAEAWEIIRRTPEFTYLILTKRPDRIARCLPADWGDGYPNVWLGTSAENQKYADQRIPELLKVPAAKRFLSLEPLLGPINLTESVRRFPDVWKLRSVTRRWRRSR
jgi:protein gp37